MPTVKDFPTPRLAAALRLPRQGNSYANLLNVSVGTFLGAGNSVNSLITDGDIESVRITRGRQGVGSTPTPAVATVRFRINPSTNPAVGLKSLKQLYAGAQLYVTASALFWLDRLIAGVPLGGPGTVATFDTRFLGKLSDVAPVELRPAGKAAPVVEVTASSFYARLSQVTIGRAPWMPGTTDKQIVLDTIQLGITADGGMGSTVARPFDAITPRVGVDPGLARWDVDAQTPDQIISDLMASTGGEFVELRNGGYDWISREAHRDAPVAFTLPPDAIIAPQVGQDTAGLINSVDVDYPVDLDGNTARVHAEDAVSIAGTASRPALGRWPARLSTRLASADAAANVAADLIGRNAYPEWTLSAVTVDLVALLEAERWQLARDVIAAQPAALINVDALPDYSPARGGLFWIVDMAETITRSSWRVDLTLAPYAQAAPPVRISDAPAGLAIQDVPDWVTFSRATVWQPDPIPAGSFREQPSNALIANVPAGTRFIDV